MNDDTINRKEAINAVLRNLNKEEYRSSWESGAVKVMKDTLEKMPTENRPVNGVLFKGRLEEGNYNLIKTTDGWVLKGKISYAGLNFADRPQGEWVKHDDERDYCSRCKHIFKTRTITQQDKWTRYIDDLGYNYCPNCGADMREREGE